MSNISKEMFSPVRHKRSSENVMEQILARIEEGMLKPGDKLESERILAEEFGVSQPCVREALRALELMGVVRVERGKGAFILESAGLGSGLSIWKQWASLNSNKVLEILQVRGALENKIIELICERCQELDFGPVIEITRKMRDCLAQSPLNGTLASQLDLEFHTQLAKMSGNTLLSSLTCTVNQLISIDRRAVFSVEGRLAASVQEHEALLAALQAGDFDQAKDLGIRHINNTQKAFKDAASS